MRKEKDITFTLDSSKYGQLIQGQGDYGGREKLPDLPLSRKPIFLGHLFKTTSGLPVSFELKSKNGSNLSAAIAKIIGPPGKQMIAIAPKGSDKNTLKTAFNETDSKGRKLMTLTLVAKQAGNASYHAAAPVERLCPETSGKDVFFEERRMDERFDSKKTAFKSRMGVSGDKGDYLFDSDSFDSDGDGVSNLLNNWW